jgi:hypothetical protein
MRKVYWTVAVSGGDELSTAEIENWKVPLTVGVPPMAHAPE